MLVSIGLIFLSASNRRYCLIVNLAFVIIVNIIRLSSVEIGHFMTSEEDMTAHDLAGSVRIF